MLRVATVGGVLGLMSGRRLGLLAVRGGPENFVPMADRCLAGEVAIHVDRTFTLDETAEALAHVGEGRALGKVVVTPG